VANEIWRLGTLYAARAFRFTGTGAPASHAAAIAKELMQRGLHVVYGRSASPALAMPDIFPILYASGCRAIDWTLESGSQRLIEDYFGHEFTVSHAETVMSACRSADIFTAARFTYPTPADDYHTESETLRLLSRTRPDAVLFEFPDVRPGSVWYEKADDFGFTLNKENYLANRLRCRRRFPLPPHRWPSLPFRLGRLSAGEVIRKQEQMALAAGAHSALLFFSGLSPCGRTSSDIRGGKPSSTSLEDMPYWGKAWPESPIGSRNSTSGPARRRPRSAFGRYRR
jgi:hypothetical protein